MGFFSGFYNMMNYHSIRALLFKNPKAILDIPLSTWVVIQVLQIFVLKTFKWTWKWNKFPWTTFIWGLDESTFEITYQKKRLLIVSLRRWAYKKKLLHRYPTVIFTGLRTCSKLMNVALTLFMGGHEQVFVLRTWKKFTFNIEISFIRHHTNVRTQWANTLFKVSKITSEQRPRSGRCSNVILLT